MEARGALSVWLADADCPDAIKSDALIVVNELVTNAVTHARSDAVVVAILDDMRLRLEVHDNDPTPPATIEPTSAGGFGLPIITALCDTWGWEPTEYGKRVWTETLC